MAGEWTFMNVLGAEEGPYSVAQLRGMFQRCRAGPHVPRALGPVLFAGFGLRKEGAAQCMSAYMFKVLFKGRGN